MVESNFRINNYTKYGFIFVSHLLSQIFSFIVSAIVYLSFLKILSILIIVLINSIFNCIHHQSNLKVMCKTGLDVCLIMYCFHLSWFGFISRSIIIAFLTNHMEKWTISIFNSQAILFLLIINMKYNSNNNKPRIGCFFENMFCSFYDWWEKHMSYNSHCQKKSHNFSKCYYNLIQYKNSFELVKHSKAFGNRPIAAPSMSSNK